MTIPDPAIVRPVFLIGAQRGGTTLCYRSLALHPDVAVLSNVSRRFPRSPALARVYGRLRRSEKPAEANRVWSRGSDRDDDHRGVADVTPGLRAWLRDVVRARLRSTGRSRFVNKCPSNSLRVPFLDAVFPDAVFVHVVRDGRAAAVSALRAFEQRRIRRPIRLAAADERRGLPPLLRCALAWQRCTEAAIGDLGELPPHRAVEVRYEELVAAPRATFRGLLERCELRVDEALVEHLAAPVRSENRTWQHFIAQDDLAALEDLIGPTLDALGYRTAARTRHRA